ncbi:unnamed protein product [Heligmosomoides polygyrus]|uniref:Ssl1-like domain-containing protein n=1 Tax=Heligmosomoides polygyrus TaxID=6339 RepID=A0A3P8FCD8_HELPZ|nr:unnamed protein product [Heligmosomoides polygyrus]
MNSFLEKFFQQNPISKREGGLILVKDKKAERFVSLAGYIRVLKESLASFIEAICSGDYSLQNALQLILTDLKISFQLLRVNYIRCSLIGVSVEQFVCKQLTKITNG